MSAVKNFRETLNQFPSHTDFGSIVAAALGNGQLTEIRGATKTGVQFVETNNEYV